MRCEIYVICLLCAMLFVFAGSRMRVRTFVKRQTVLDRTGFSKTQSTRSGLKCATACAQDDICQKYSYDNNTCRMGESANGSGTLYKSYDKCPADRGYYVWAYDDMQLCLKYTTSEMNQEDATNICKNDGGHLILMESTAANVRINGILTELNAKDSVWLDGYDASTKNLFLSWKGEPLTWIGWGAGNPDDYGDDNCLFGIPSEGYKHRDIDCYGQSTVLCQIDMM